MKTKIARGNAFNTLHTRTSNLKENYLTFTVCLLCHSYLPDAIKTIVNVNDDIAWDDGN